MNKLNTAKRVAIVAALVEGNSLRATSRMTGVSLPTVTKLLVDMGDVSSRYQDALMRHLPCKRIECDEIWSFCYGKAKNLPADKKNVYGFGDVWTWVAICADTKLVPSWLVGTRNGIVCGEFINDLASRVQGRVQVTTDAHQPYKFAIEMAFGDDVDYAIMQKTYGKGQQPDSRYSPATITGMFTEVLKGNPDPGYISTSYVERQNLTMRMGMRRFTRLTNGFSKKVENHAMAVALHFAHYNFCRVHKTLRITPAMAAGIADHVWGIDELVGLLELKEEIKRVA